MVKHYFWVYLQRSFQRRLSIQSSSGDVSVLSGQASCKGRGDVNSSFLSGMRVPILFCPWTSQLQVLLTMVTKICTSNLHLELDWELNHQLPWLVNFYHGTLSTSKIAWPNSSEYPHTHTSIHTYTHIHNLTYILPVLFLLQTLRW